VILGPWDVRIVSGGGFRLDGGAMFGTVPKAVWGRLFPADADNTIAMASNCLLLRGEVEGRRRTVLVETGNGGKETEAFMSRFKLEGRDILERSLAREGVRPEDIDLVVLTHLHFDHAGGVTRLGPDGRAVPSFPGARHVLQQRDLDNARRAHLRERASYLPWNWEPLEAAGLLDPVQGACELLPGLSVRPVPGHTPGLQAVEVTGGGRRLVFPSDLIPTAQHIQPAWVMGYDLDVVTCVDERLKLLQEVAGTDTVLAFYHDPRVPAGTVDLDERGKYRVTPVAI